MPEILRWEGTVGGEGIARDLWSDADDDQFVSVVIQNGMPVGDDELNLIGQIAEAGLRRLARGLVSDGLASGGGFVCTDQLAPPTPNTIYLQRATFLVDGFPILVGDHRNQGGLLNLSHAVKIVLDAPPTGANARNDSLMLEFWFEEVGSPGQTGVSTTVYELGGAANVAAPNGNDIQNIIIASETTRRVQARWRIRAIDSQTTIVGQTAWGAVDSNVSGLTYALMPGSTAVYRAGGLSTDGVRDQGTLDDANTLQTINGFSYAIQIATVNRLPNVTTITPADITAGPPVCQLQVQIPRSQINPPLPNPLPGEDDYPDTFLYNGSLGDSTDGSGGTLYGLLSQHLATKFSVNRGGSTSGALLRVELQLQRSRTGSGSTAGADLTVDIVTDNTGPTGPVLASFTLPKEWLTDTPRWISIPINVSIAWNGTYWVRLHQGGSGAGYVSWTGEPSTSADRTRSLASTGAITDSWATTNGWISVLPDLHLRVYVDTSPVNIFLVPTNYSGPTLFDQVMNVIEGTAPAVSVTEYEYDPVAGMLYTADASYDATGALLDANLVQYTHDANTQAITKITRLSARN